MTAVADETASAPTKLGVAAQYALLAGPLLSMLDSSIVNVAVTPIAVQLHAGLATVGWTVSAYLLALGTGLAAVSSVARRFGIIAVYRASLVLFTLASLACAVAPTVGVLIGARVCQGLFGAPLVPLAMTVLLGGSSRAISPVGGILLFTAPALGPSLGGALVAASDWRAIFLVNVPLGALAVLATLAIAHGHVPGPSAGARFDPVGMLLVAAGLTLLLYGAAQAGTHGWSTPATWVAVAVGAVVLASYPWWAGRHSHPALDLTLARHRDSLLALLLCAAASVVTFAAVFLIPVFLQAVQGHSALAAGLAMLPQGVLTGLGTVIGQRVLTRVSVRTTVLVGFALLATASAALFTIQVHTSIPVTAAILAVRAASIGLVITPLLAVMVRPLNSQQLADANALFNIVQRIAGSFGVGALASWYASAAVHHGPLSALHWIALVLVFLAALAAAFSVLLPTFRNTRLEQVSSATVDGRGADDVEALRAALKESIDSVNVTLSLPRESAKKVLTLLDAERTTGAVVVPVKELFTTTEAATMLGLSRPTLMKLIASGQIADVKVGSHHRVPAEAILEFQRARRARRDKAAEELASFSNEIGFVE